jgi:hypothetical protein
MPMEMILRLKREACNYLSMDKTLTTPSLRNICRRFMAQHGGNKWQQ